MPKGVYIRKPITENTRKILSESHKGHIPWNKGNIKPMPNCLVCFKKLSDLRSTYCRKHVPVKNIGRKASNETRQKMSNSRKKQNNSNWKGGKEYILKKWAEKRKVWCLNRIARKKKALGSYTFTEWELKKKEYNYTCPSCLKKEPLIKLSQDHIIPLIKGGSNFIDNIQPLCMPCNSSKHIKIIKYTIPQNT